jgi:hypothetical protein
MTDFDEIIDPHLADQAGQLRGVFDRAKPFRHLCIDGFLTLSAAAQALADFPSFKAENAINEFGVVGGKAVETKLANVSPFYKDLYDCFVSQPFLDLMSDVTGIPELLPDPNLFGGGTHENRDGQELDPHVDFNRMEDLSAYRRLNLLIYLNPGWKAAWGGSIELHSDPRQPETNQISGFEPIFNRAVIFETSEFSWHGFPKIRLPENKKHLSRKSISIYLYTKTRPADEIAAPHATFYVQRPMGEFLAAGYTLTASDVTEIKEALTRRDAWIEHYQNKELALTEQVEGGRKFLEEVLGNLRAPINGHGIQEGKLTGMYHDRWVGPKLALTIQPKRPVTRVAVHGWVPDDMPSGGILTLQAGDETEVRDLIPGAFILSVEIPEGSESAIPIKVEATDWVTPEGPGGRTLVFVLQEIELVHDN